MITALIILVIFISTLTIDSQNLLSARLKILLGSIHIQMTIGNPSTEMLELIDQDNQYIWTTSRFFNINTSKTSNYIGESTILFNNKNYRAFEYQDILAFEKENKTSTISFKFVSGSNDLSLDAGGFPFPHIYINNNTSILHVLKSENKIDHLAYSIVFIFKQEGFFYFGGIPSFAIEQKKKGTCKVASNNDKWGCDLYRVYFSNGNSTYNNVCESYFQSKELIVNAPLDFINYMIENILKPFFDRKECRYSDTDFDIMSYIECSNIIKEELPLITFEFSSMTVSLSLDKFFAYYSHYSKLLIQNDHTNGNIWIFGSSFLVNFNSLFDYENNLISLYSNDGIIQTKEIVNQKIENESNDKGFYCYLIVICLLLIGLSLLLIIKVVVLNKNNSDFINS